MATKKTKTAAATKSQGERHTPPENLEGHIFYGLTLNEEQTIFRDAIWSKDIDIVFASARSGSGKTLVAVATSMLMFEEGIIDGIIYMSAAGVYEHKQGLLPGTLEQKSLILQTPLRQALVDLGYDPDRVISSDSSMMAQKDGTACIMAQTDSYIRGINIGSKDHKVMLIVDEAQNFTRSALRTVLTRVGDGSFAVVIGQARQCDLKYPQDSGFIPAIELFRSEPWCKICTLTESYRSRISQKADEL